MTTRRLCVADRKAAADETDHGPRLSRQDAIKVAREGDADE